MSDVLYTVCFTKYQNVNNKNRLFGQNFTNLTSDSENFLQNSKNFNPLIHIWINLGLIDSTQFNPLRFRIKSQIF